MSTLFFRELFSMISLGGIFPEGSSGEGAYYAAYFLAIGILGLTGFISENKGPEKIDSADVIK